jgi:AbrB family looped-hinge helix DNA binding protein
MQTIVNIDKFGRILIPKHLRNMCGLFENATVAVEAIKNKLILIPVHKRDKSITRKIASMNLPVDDWKVMEQESTCRKE